MPAQRTLIICSAPRTGSYELCRYLAAAGIGVPHEYFNPNYAYRLAKRWAFRGDALTETELGRYVDLLRRRRSQNGVFATKLQFRHFDTILRNQHGAALFQNACIVHLFRHDVANQFASLRAALESGRWDFSERQTTQSIVRHHTRSESFVHQAIDGNGLATERGCRLSPFVCLLKIRPLFVTSEDLFINPGKVVTRIADATSVTIDAQRLTQSIAVSGSLWQRAAAQKSVTGLTEKFKEIAFQKNPPALIR